MGKGARKIGRSLLLVLLGAACSAMAYILHSFVATRATEVGAVAVKECRHIQHQSWLGSWGSVPSDDQERWKKLKVGFE